MKKESNRKNKKANINKNGCIFISATAIAVMGLMTGCKDPENMSNYDRGVAALSNQDYNTALDAFIAAEEDHNDMQLVYRGEGIANLGLANYEQSVDCFEKALHTSNGIVKKIDYDINFYLATAQYKMGDLEGAYNTYNAITTLDKKNSDACYLMGKVALDRGDVNGAKSSFDAALSIDSTDPYLYINIYKTLAEAGDEQDAKTYINRALKNVPKPTSYELGIFNYYLGDYTQARNYFEETKNIKSSAEGVIYLGKTYEALGDTGYAASLYEMFLANDPSSTEIYNELGNLKFAERDYEGARSTYEAGLKSTDTTFRQSLMFNRIVTYEYLQDYKTAATLIKEYISLYPDDEIAAREDIFLRTR